MNPGSRLGAASDQLLWEQAPGSSLVFTESVARPIPVPSGLPRTRAEAYPSTKLASMDSGFQLP